jgi:hypothetical protein
VYKKQIRSKDLDGNPIVEDYYFNLNKAELVKMQVSEAGGLEVYMARIAKEQDAKKMIQLFQDVILLAYGVRSEDNVRFIKNDELREEFMQTDAYSELFWELSNDAGAAAKFFVNVIPKELAQKINDGEQVINLPTSEVSESSAAQTFEGDLVVKTGEAREVYTRQQLLDMPLEDFDRLIGRDPLKMSHVELQVAMQRRNVSL